MKLEALGLRMQPASEPTGSTLGKDVTNPCYKRSHDLPLEEWYPTFLAPGTGFVEDYFSMEWGWHEDGFRMIQAHYIYYALSFFLFF